MNHEHAVRYLLLKQLWRLRDQVPAELHRSVARSLEVAPSGKDYLIRWSVSGRTDETRVPRTAFVLYRRGDLDAASEGAADFAAQNKSLARRLGCEILGLAPGTQPTEPRTVDMIPVLRLGGLARLALLGAMLASAPAQLMGVGLALAGWMLLEFTGRRSASLTPLACALLLFVDAPRTALLAGAGLAALAVLDPDPRGRPAKSLGGVVVALAGVGWVISGGTGLGLESGVQLGLAALALAVRTLYGAQGRSYPLLFPLACAGLGLDGFTSAAWLGLAGVGVELAILHRLGTGAWFAQGST